MTLFFLLVEMANGCSDCPEITSILFPPLIAYRIEPCWSWFILFKNSIFSLMSLLGICIDVSQSSLHIWALLFCCSGCAGTRHEHPQVVCEVMAAATMLDPRDLLSRSPVKIRLMKNPALTVKPSSCSNLLRVSVASLAPPLVCPITHSL